MDSATHTDLPHTQGGIFKRILLFIGRSILVVLGILQIAGTLIITFEESLSFLEISTLEMIFFVALFFLVKNYIDASKRHNLDWKMALYRPLRNLGWYMMVGITLVIFESVTTGKLDLSMEDANAWQIIDYIIVMFCIHLATPKERDDKKTTSGAEVNP